MTQPATIFFGPDENGNPKVYLRKLLFSTSRRGQLVEYMYVTLQRGETKQAFNRWVYGEKDLARGSGLFVGENGLSANHHFLLPAQETGFQFRAGDYQLRVWARRVGDDEPRLLADANLTVTGEDAQHIASDSGGLYFDWGPESKRYHSHREHTDSRKKYTERDFMALMDAVGQALKTTPPDNKTPG